MKAFSRSLLLAPFTLKGSLSALQAGNILNSLCERYLPQIPRVIIPLADGGDDSLVVLKTAAKDFETRRLFVTGPLPGMKTEAEYVIAPNRELIVIEAAQAHGLVKSPVLRPLEATSYGVGELIRHGLLEICKGSKKSGHTKKTLVVTLGGSASSDGGTGALQALGFRFLKSAGDECATPISIPELQNIAVIQAPPDLDRLFDDNHVSLLIATDVTNPLCGARGAAWVYAPQKGATLSEIETIEGSLRHFAESCVSFFGVDRSEQAGAGAAGGLAFGLSHLPHSRIVSGFEWLSAQIGLASALDQAEIILTMEGCFDAQSLQGKGTGRLIEKSQNKPVIIICGQAQADLQLPANVTVFPLISDNRSVEEAMQNPVSAIETIFPDVVNAILSL